jgi:autotransporter-associated beta strand protein
MLNGTVTVGTTADAVDGNVSSIAALIASPGPDGKISLREAIEAANNTPSSGTAPNVIVLPAGSYVLTEGELDVGNSTNLATDVQGAGAASTIIQHDTSTAAARILNIDPLILGNCSFSLSGCTLQHGRSSDGFGGGAVICGGPDDSTTFSATDFFDNQITDTATNSPGGAIASADGSLNITNCSFGSTTAGTGNSSNRSGGGAVWFGALTSGSNLVVQDSTFTDNTALTTTAGAGGGAIQIENDGAATNPMADIDSSTFASNIDRGGDGGGAVYVAGGVNVTLAHNTFANNQVAKNDGNLDAGGAVFFSESGGSSLAAQFNRFVGNTSAVSAHGNILAVTASTGSATIDDNWWASDAGPGANDIGSGTGLTSITPADWLQLKLSANASSLSPGQNSTLTASFLSDSANNVISASDLTALIGLPVIWNGGNSGTLSNEQATIESGGTATATFTAVIIGTDQPSAQVDNPPAAATIITINVVVAPWTGGGANSNWSTAANWGGTVLAALDLLLFNGDQRLSNTNDLAPGTEFYGIAFPAAAGPFVLNGNTLNLSGSIVNSSSNTQTVKLPLVLVGGSHTLDAAAGNEAIGGNISETGGPQGIVISGPGSVTLSGVNSYSGGTTVASGRLIVTNPSALRDGTSLAVGAGGTSMFGSSMAAWNATAATAMSVSTSSNAAKYGAVVYASDNPPASTAPSLAKDAPTPDLVVSPPLALIAPTMVVSKKANPGASADAELIQHVGSQALDAVIVRRNAGDFAWLTVGASASQTDDRNQENKPSLQTHDAVLADYGEYTSPG